MAQHYEIERGIPLPSRSTSALPVPLDKMQPGDSVFVPCSTGERDRVSNSVSVRARAWSIRYTKGEARFAYRTMEGGFRIWRVA